MKMKRALRVKYKILKEALFRKNIDFWLKLNLPEFVLAMNVEAKT